MNSVDAFGALFPETVKSMTKVINLPIIGISKNRKLKGVSITTTQKI